MSTAIQFERFESTEVEVPRKQVGVARSCDASVRKSLRGGFKSIHARFRKSSHQEEANQGGFFSIYPVFKYFKYSNEPNRNPIPNQTPHPSHLRLFSIFPLLMYTTTSSRIPPYEITLTELRQSLLTALSDRENCPGIIIGIRYEGL